MFCTRQFYCLKTMQMQPKMNKPWRKSSQFILPAQKQNEQKGKYGLYPTHSIGNQKIHLGFDSLLKELLKSKTLLLDGYMGVFFQNIREVLQSHFNSAGKTIHWIDVSEYYKTESEINELIEPFLGGKDPIFGKRTTLNLSDFFELEKLQNLEASKTADLTIFYGTGASLVPQKGTLVYFDLPKNELQFRARAKSVSNLGASQPDEIKPM